MGSQQSKQAKQAEQEQLQQNEKFSSFFKVFLASVDAIASNPETICKITLANDGVVPLTWEILEKKFPGCVVPGCTVFEPGKKVVLLTSQLWFLSYRKLNITLYATFWEARETMNKVRAFYNGEF